MTAWASGLYQGVVTHQRLRPQRHRLGYRIFQMLLDLDELPALDRAHRLFSFNRFNLISFHDRDHGAGDGAPLRQWVERQLAAAGLDLGGGRVQILCMPRVLGQAFNPLSLYFCHHRSGALAAILYQVNNTFGQRHSYLLQVSATEARHVRQSCEKLFHVSPFMDMGLRYDFDVRPPTGDLFVGVSASDTEGPLLLARFAARRAELSDRVLGAAFLGHPLLALKVLGAIHWEAVKLLAKGIRLRPQPPAPAAPVTIVAQGPVSEAA